MHLPPPSTRDGSKNDESVAVVVTTYDDADFLRDALISVLAQQRAPSEIIVVDDGSEASPAHILEDFPQAVLLRKENGGLASARNLGLRTARSRFIAFLDADDRLLPNALAAGLNCFAARPDAEMVYGGHRRIRADGTAAGPDNYTAIGDDAYCSLLAANCIGMHAAVLYRRDTLVALGGFDERLLRCEDYDLYLRLARQHSIASHPEIVAEYRWHGRNMSRDTAEMLRAALAVHDQHREQQGARLQAWRAGQRTWRAWYRKGQRAQWGDGRGGAPIATLRSRVRSAGKAMRPVFRWMPGSVTRLAARMAGVWPPPVGAVNFGSFNSTRPISTDFGWGRGLPIDRYYISRFLAQHADDIAGRVLEIGDDAYSRTYGGPRVARQDVLHVHRQGEKTTLVGDLTSPGVLPEGAFDCIILTQTLHLIFDLEQAVARLHAALKPGGVLLLTTPGISPIDRGEWQSQWCWSFSAIAIRRLFERKFDPQMLKLHSFGNVYAATAFLQGVVLDEVDRAKLDIQDPAYPVIVGLRATRT